MTGSGLLERHVGLVRTLREAGVPVSLAEDLDAVDAVGALAPADLLDRSTVRAVYAATLVKRPSHRPTFDTLFDLWFPPLVGAGSDPAEGLSPRGDGPADLAEFRERLADALGEPARQGGGSALEALGREAVGRFGAMPGRAPGQSAWSAYTAVHRVHPQALVDQVVAGLLAGPGVVAGEPADEDLLRRLVERRVAAFTAAAEADARRRVAEQKGPEHLARHAVRPALEEIDFTSARRRDLEELRRQVQPLARRLATRLTRERAARRRGPLDVRRTVRASIATGGVPLETRYRPKRPGRTDLVVLCDVSGSVAGFAQFTLLLVYALREQFTGVRAFTFVDDVAEVTEHLKPGADPVDVMTALAASVEQAALHGRTHYGRALERFLERHADALTPRSSLLVLGDARSNLSDLALPTLRRMTHEVRHAWWLNPEPRRHWDTGDSAASAYAEVVPMVECRNLAQLTAFVRRLAG